MQLEISKKTVTFVDYLSDACLLKSIRFFFLDLKYDWFWYSSVILNDKISLLQIHKGKINITTQQLTKIC